MFKLLGVGLLAASLVPASTALAGCGCSSGSGGGAVASAPVTTAQAGSPSRRTYSYDPGMGSYRGYRAPSMRGSGGWTRDAGSKVRGDFGR